MKETVGLYSDVPSIDFDTEGRPDIPTYSPNTSFNAPQVEVDVSYDPFKETSYHRENTQTSQWESLYSGLTDSQDEPSSFFDTMQEQPKEESLIDEKAPCHYQYKGQYIMTSVKSGLMIVDQHRAHIRILYEQFLEHLANKVHSSQKILYPEVFEAPVSKEPLFAQIMPELENLGFEIAPLGASSYAISAVPVELEGINLQTLLNDMLDDATEKGNVSAIEEIRQTIALTMAKNAAIPLGQVLSNDEMDDLITSLFTTTNVNYTPTGQPILCILKQQEISRLFG